MVITELNCEAQTIIPRDVLTIKEVKGLASKEQHDSLMNYAHTTRNVKVEVKRIAAAW